MSISPTLISVMLFTYDYPLGTPQGMFAEKGVAWLLREDRALPAEDLFDQSRSWTPALARLVFATAKRKEGDSIPRGVSPAALATVAADPDHWLILEHGLVVRFMFNDLSLSAVGGVEAEIPWSALKPYLVSAPPVSIAPK